ncbi:MAG: ATP-binding protein [Calditrichaeota bacterium]|nr:MAG: ATP-binding protein [Calditrichota bacterium]
MQAFEKLGLFYLGRKFDPAGGGILDEAVLYEARDLTTHAVCVGMTGSGKTGLCVSLIEEATIDGIPSLVVDPKGDLTNLLLAFPELRPEDFEPWINPEEALQKNLTTRELAERAAALWRKGLAEWGQDGERIRRFAEAAERQVYTPGSSAGVPISILGSLMAPPEAVRQDQEVLQDRVSTTVTSLLSLLGEPADPLQSRPHIFLSNLFSTHWQQGQDLDLARLIHEIQDPPLERIGVFDLESFLPAEQRFQLAMKLNNLLAAPGFSIWLEGEPLNIQNLLYTAEGKPRVAILTLAHLSPGERMFFVSLLLNEVLAWIRTQPGTTSLRALLYIDELFGFMPPVANPPSKKPLLTLLKQARAFGLGLVLATQNPVDLDYKGLSNAGTWFVGRLQTEQDLNRLLDGLENLRGGAGREAIARTIRGLAKRVFYLHNVHEKEPVVFHTRWAMSYLCGPLTRAQIKQLKQAALRRATAQPPLLSTAPMQGAHSRAPTPATSREPILPPGLEMPFLSPAPETTGNGQLVYCPSLLWQAEIEFRDARKNIEHTRALGGVLELDELSPRLPWELSEPFQFAEQALREEPPQPGEFLPFPSGKWSPRLLTSWEKDLKTTLYRTETLALFYHPVLKQYSHPGESEADFRLRCSQQLREKRDQWLEKVREKYARKLERLQGQLLRAQERLEREQTQYRQQTMQTAISFGTALLGAFLGRKAVSRTTLGRAGTAARGIARTRREKEDIERAREAVARIQEKIQALEAELQQALSEAGEQFGRQAEELKTITVRPRKSAIFVAFLKPVWLPFYRDASGRLHPAWG